MPSPRLNAHSIHPRWKPWFMVLLAVVLTATPALPIRAEEVIARLLEIQGLVEVRHQGGAAWEKATEGMALQPGDTVRTQGQSQATLLRPDGTTLELFPLSEATVEDEKAIMLFLGKIWSKFQKAIGRPHEIRTPSSVALIRGTVLSVETESTGASQVAVVEGLVEVVDRQGQQREMVGAGFAVRADREGRLARMERARPETLNEGRGFMERMERRGPMRSGSDGPDRGPADRGREGQGPEGRGPEGRGPEGKGPGDRDNRPEDRGSLQERLERRGGGEFRGEHKVRLEERLERGAGERLERLIDRTQREGRREQAEQRREERRNERQDEQSPQNPGRGEELIDRLRDRLRRDL